MSYNLPHFTRQYRDKYGRALAVVRDENRKLRLENDRLRGFCDRLVWIGDQHDGRPVFDEAVIALYDDIKATLEGDGGKVPGCS